MKIDTREVMNGYHNGKVVWITHYNKPDSNKKPLRNIKPTKCLIRCNEEFPPDKVVYYSRSYFAPLNKKDLPLKKVISPVDNTGYRSRSGNPLNVFTDEEEAQRCYDKEYLSFHPKPTHVSISIKCVEELVELLNTPYLDFSPTKEGQLYELVHILEEKIK